MLELCVSLISIRCWVALVEVLNRIRSKRFSALVSGWEDIVSEIMEFILVIKVGS